MPTLIEKAIFIDASDEQKKFVISLFTLQKISSPLFLNSDNPEEIARGYEEGKKTLFVSCGPDTTNIKDLLFSYGSIYLLPFEEVLLDLESFFALFDEQIFEKTVVTAFLDPSYTKILKYIFELFNFQLSHVSNLKELNNILEVSPDHLVIDLDMNGETLAKRNSTLSLIHRKIISSNKLSVNVIKNFNNGSIFNDICSPVNKICDIILSPQEYTVFIIKILHMNLFENSNLSLHTARQSWLPGKKTGNGEFKPLSNVFNYLKRPKSVYNTLCTTINNPLHSAYLKQMKLIQMKKNMIFWLKDYIESSITSEQGSFTFSTSETQLKEYGTVAV